jgi:hypothetical protein
LARSHSIQRTVGAWRKAGDWPLPFRGRGEYAPEHDLWFGFSHKDKHLCVADLTAVSMERPTVPRKLWRDLVWPREWNLRLSHLLPLGAGKLCIARFFRTLEEDMSGCCCCMPPKINNFVVLAGVEVVSRQGKLRFIKDKTERYSWGDDFANPL